MPLFWLSLAFLVGIALSGWVVLPVCIRLVLASVYAIFILFPWLFRQGTTRASGVVHFILGLLPVRASQSLVKLMTAPALPGALAPSFLIPLALCVLSLGVIVRLVSYCLLGVHRV